MTTRSGSAGRRKWWDDSSYSIYLWLPETRTPESRQEMHGAFKNGQRWGAQLEQPNEDCYCSSPLQRLRLASVYFCLTFPMGLTVSYELLSCRTFH